MVVSSAIHGLFRLLTYIIPFSNSLPPATSDSLPLIACMPFPSGVGRPSRFESEGMPASWSALVLVPGTRRASSQSLSRKPQVGAIKPVAREDAEAILRAGPAGPIVVWIPNDT